MRWDELVEDVIAAHPDLVMREWALVPESQGARWRELVERAI